ncbi:MAG: O-antigen ligase family protein [Candidatus Kapabacteria bacterium]|nr:O-antigen ligase family protein [Candidatus Kapabacteria bacterium]
MMIHQLRNIDYSALLFTLLFLAFTAISALIQLPWLPLVVLVALVVIYVVIKHPQVWLTGIIVSYIGFVGTQGKGLSTLDVLYAGFLFGTLSVWFLWRLLVSEKRLLRDSTDWMVFLTLVFTVLTNVYTSFSEGTMPIDWAREWVISILLLYYIPFREYFQDKKHFAFFQIGFACLVVLIVGSNLLLYYKIARGSEYAYQITGVRSGEQLVSLGILFGLSYFIHSKNVIVKILSAIVGSVAMIGIIAGYTRSYWLSVIALLIMMTFYVGKNERRKIVLMVGTVFAVAGLLLFTVFGGLGDIILKVMAKRFISTGNYKKDIALNERIYESRKVLKLITDEPLQGHGFGTQYIFWDPLANHSIKYSWIHNGYLSSVFKVGIPGTIIILIFHCMFLTKGVLLLLLLRKNREKYKEIIVFALPAVLGNVLLLVVSISSNQFHDRVGGMAFAICYSAIAIAEIRWKKHQGINSKQLSVPTTP